MDQFDRIVAAEEQFAKEIVLNVFYLRPPRMWQNLIPGMFIFDFLRRTAAIRRYTKKYMFPRRIAMDAVREHSSGESKEAAARRIEQRIEAELLPLQLPSPALARAYHRLIELLTGHYSRLTRAQGESYDELVRNAYPTIGEYENHLKLLAAAENDVDKAVVEVAGPGKSLGEDLQLEADQVEARRRKVLERIFEPAV
jgi:DNA-binding Lrp family transcriptional regulator